VLVVCGSFVPATTAQLERLAQRYPEASVPARVAALARRRCRCRGRADLAGGPADRIGRAGSHVVATERERDPGLVDAASQQRVAGAWLRSRGASRQAS